MANIAFLLNNYPSGGVERVTSNLIPHLVALGHKVFIFVHKLNHRHLVKMPVKYIKIPHEAWRNENKNEKIVEKAIQRHGIEVFLVPIVSPEYIFRLKKRNACAICYISHGAPFYELKEIENNIHQRWNTSKKTLRDLRKFFFYTLRLNFGRYRRRTISMYKRRHEELDAFGVLNDHYKDMIAKEIGVNIDDSKFFTLPNPLPPLAENLPQMKRKKRVIFVGRLSYADKRVDRLLKIWELVCKKFPEWGLTIIGDGPEEKELKQYVILHNLPRVEFIKFTATPEVYYKESEILCLTSDFEGCPMVLLEAQQHGCATIAFDCSYGVRDILSPNGENGMYVPNGDIGAYAKALAHLMEDEELRRKIQKNSIENVKRFSVENSVKQYDALIRKLCSK